MFDELLPEEVGDVPSGVIDHGCTVSECDSEELVEGACPDDVISRLDCGRASRDFVTRADGGIRLDEVVEVFSGVAVSGGELGEVAGHGVGEFFEPIVWTELWFQVGGHAV